VEHSTDRRRCGSPSASPTAFSAPVAVPSGRLAAAGAPRRGACLVTCRGRGRVWALAAAGTEKPLTFFYSVLAEREKNFPRQWRPCMKALLSTQTMNTLYAYIYAVIS
jgi:hypothetical protein